VTARAVIASVLLGAGCASPPTILPQIDRPPDGADADPFTDLDSLDLSVAEPGASDALISASFPRGAPVEVSGVELGGQLVVHLVGRQGQTEIAYGRTCPFDSAVETTPHLYFARTVHWGPMAGAVATTRAGGAALVDAGSGVLLFGGDDGSGAPVTTVERFVPLAGTFAILGDASPRHGAIGATLGDGRAVLVGGSAPGGGAPGFYETISPTAAAGRAIERVDSAAYDLADGAIATLSDGRAIAIGGTGSDGTPRADVVTFGDEEGLVIARTSRAHLASARARHTATRISDDLGAPVIVIGGVGSDGMPVAVAELYKPLRDELAAPALFAPRMLVPRSQHRVVRTPDGGLLVIGGLDAAGLPVRQLELFSIDGGFADAGQLPVGAGVIDESVTLLPDGRILIAGGRTAVDGPPSTSAFIARLDPVDGSVDVVATDQMDAPRLDAQAALLCDGTVMVVGGGDGAVSGERYNPPEVGRR